MHSNTRPALLYSSDYKSRRYYPPRLERQGQWVYVTGTNPSFPIDTQALRLLKDSR
jgi:hypothetical protein